jgi:chemotaxis-related protein WspB
MLFLLFQIGNDRYALEARQAIEVLPFLSLKKIPQSPAGVAGIFNYRGQPVPAVDLSELTLGRPSHERLSTRIILVQYSDSLGRQRLLGLIAEQATGMMRREEREFVESGVRPLGARYLGPVLMDNNGVIQLLQAQHLLGENIQQLLFAEESKSSPVESGGDGSRRESLSKSESSAMP